MKTKGVFLLVASFASLFALLLGVAFLLENNAASEYRTGSELSYLVLTDNRGGLKEDLTDSINEYCAVNDAAVFLVRMEDKGIHGYYAGCSKSFPLSEDTVYVRYEIITDGVFMGDGVFSIEPDIPDVRPMSELNLPPVLSDLDYLVPISKCGDMSGRIYTDGDVAELKSILESQGVGAQAGTEKRRIAGDTVRMLYVLIIIADAVCYFFVQAEYARTYRTWIRIRRIFGETKRHLLLLLVTGRMIYGAFAITVLLLVLRWKWAYLGNGTVMRAVPVLLLTMTVVVLAGSILSVLTGPQERSSV